MAERSPSTLRQIATSLAVEAARAQRALDRDFEERLVATAAHAEELGSDPERDLLPVLLPQRYRFASHRVDASLGLASRRSIGARVGLELSGFLVHSFFHVRFATEETEHHRLSVLVESHPTKESNDG